MAPITPTKNTSLLHLLNHNDQREAFRLEAKVRSHPKEAKRPSFTILPPEVRAMIFEECIKRNTTFPPQGRTLEEKLNSMQSNATPNTSLSSLLLSLFVTWIQLLVAVTGSAILCGTVIVCLALQQIPLVGPLFACFVSWGVLSSCGWFILFIQPRGYLALRLLVSWTEQFIKRLTVFLEDGPFKPLPTTNELHDFLAVWVLCRNVVMAVPFAVLQSAFFEGYHIYHVNAAFDRGEYIAPEHQMERILVHQLPIFFLDKQLRREAFEAEKCMKSSGRRKRSRARKTLVF